MPPRDALDSALSKTSTQPVSKAASAERRRVLIIVENLPSPFDRRVWQEAGALRDGESLEALASLMQIDAADKPVFFRAAKDNFARIYSADMLSAQDIMRSLP